MTGPPGPPIYVDPAWMLQFISTGLTTALMLSAPMLVAAVAVGVIISVFQAATQIQEQTLSFVPKIVATFVTVMFCAPWIAFVVTKFMVGFISNMANFVVKQKGEPVGEAHLFAMWATFLLILTRIIGFFVQSAVWGSHHASHQVLVGAALCFSILIYPNVKTPAMLDHWKTTVGHSMDLMMFVILIGQQFCVGLIMGYLSYMALAIAEFAGELFDIQMGLSSAASFDPSSHGAKNLLNRLTFYVGLTLYLMCDGHMLTLEAVKRSFQVIPLDCFTMSRSLLDLIIHRCGDMFILSLEMAAPVVAALFCVQVALGMVARVAPQMNVFMLSFPMNIGIGLTLLTQSWPFIERRFYEMFHQDWVLMLKSMVLMGPHPGAGR